MEQETEQEQLAGGSETATPEEAPRDEVTTASSHTAAVSDGPTDVESVAEPATQEVAADVAWRALPTLGGGLLRMLAAGALGTLTGLVWAIGGRTAPAGFVAALGWALALGAVPLLVMAAGLALDAGMRAQAPRRPVRATLLQTLALFVLLLVAMAAAVTVLPETATLGIPTAYALVLGLGVGFGLGGLRLRRMTGDARWFFVGLGVLALFGLALTFLVPAAVSPLANGQQGLLGCVLFVFGLPGGAVGAILGGWLRMRADWAAFGKPPALASAEAFPLELESNPWSRRAPQAPHPLDMPLAESEELSMTQPMTADAVIEELTHRRQSLLESIAGLSDEQLDRKGVVGDWSIKNALAHLVGWEEVVVRITPERARTRVKPAELEEINADEDGDNARTVAASEALTPQEQLIKAAEARARLVEMIRGLGDEALARTNPWPEWQGTLGEYFIASIGDHESEHAEAIAAGAAKLRAEG